MTKRKMTAAERSEKLHQEAAITDLKLHRSLVIQAMEEHDAAVNMCYVHMKANGFILPNNTVKEGNKSKKQRRTASDDTKPPVELHSPIPQSWLCFGSPEVTVEFLLYCFSRMDAQCLNPCACKVLLDKKRGLRKPRKEDVMKYRRRRTTSCLASSRRTRM